MSTRHKKQLEWKNFRLGMAIFWSRFYNDHRWYR